MEDVFEQNYLELLVMAELLKSQGWKKTYVAEYLEDAVSMGQLKSDQVGKILEKVY